MDLLLQIYGVVSTGIDLALAAAVIYIFRLLKDHERYHDKPITVHPVIEAVLRSGVRNGAHSKPKQQTDDFHS